MESKESKKQHLLVKNIGSLLKKNTYLLPILMNSVCKVTFRKRVKPVFLAPRLMVVFFKMSLCDFMLVFLNHYAY